MTSVDLIRHVKLSTARLPLAVPISDAKVFTGRQKPMTEVVFLFAEITTEQGHSGIGFSYSKRAGGPAQYAHAKEVAEGIIGEDPNDIGKLYTKLLWAGASVGRSGVATQALAAIDIALYDLKAKRAGLPLAKFLGSYRDSVQTYNTSGGFLNASLDEVKARATVLLDEGIGGIKIKVGLPDTAEDLRRVAGIREHIGWDVPLMVDANQQWDRATALRMGRQLEEFNLVWIEEPLDAYDFEGHAHLARILDTPIATGEMLASVAEHQGLINGQRLRHHPARRAARRRHHPVPPPRRPGGRARTGPGPALRHGNPPPPRRGLPARTVGGALRLAGSALQRTPRNQERPHAGSGPPRPGHHPQRPGAGLDHRVGGIRQVT